MCSVRRLSLVLLVTMLLLAPRASQAQDQNPTWNGVSTATAITAGVSSLLMPRVFYSSPEATTGWKARWHVSVLAPAMTQLSLALLNEAVLKDALESPRPGCDDAPAGTEGCDTFGLFSTQSYIAAASLGQGLSVFLVDTMKYSGGRFHGWSFAGNVVWPLLLTGVTVGGRIAGNYESAGQSLGSAAIGLGTGVLMGLLYSTMQAPECGYSGNLICW